MNKKIVKVYQKLMFYKPSRIPEVLSARLYAHKKNLLKYKSSIRGMLSLPEAIALHQLAESLPAKSNVLEIGCYGGLSSAFILAGLKKQSKLHSIDPFNMDIKSQKKAIVKSTNSASKDEELNLLTNKPSLQSVSQTLKSFGFKHFNLIQGYSFNVVKNWKRKLDMLVIDGNHNYNQVKKDYLDWSSFLKKGGIIAFHDANKVSKFDFWHWGWEGPTRVVKKFITNPKWVNTKKVDSLVWATKNF
jgi:predicted O-methyltransferase YrrM